MLHGYHYLLGPVAALCAVGVLVLISRWAFGTGTRSPAARRPAGPPDYGLLVPVATVRSSEDAEMLRDVLATAGIRATVAAQTPGRGFALLVFPDAAPQARDLLASSGR